MKKIILSACAGLMLPVIAAPTLDQGGVSVDFSILNKRTPSGKISQTNLIQDGQIEDPKFDLKARRSNWMGGSWVWKNGCRDDAHRKAIWALPQHTLAPGQGVNQSRALRLYTPRKVAEMRNKVGEPIISNSFTQQIKLPDLPHTVKYELTFWTRGQIYAAPGINEMRLVGEFFKNWQWHWGDQETRKPLYHTVPVAGQYQPHKVTFMVPPHTKRLRLGFALWGVGEIFLDNVALRPAALDKNLDVRVAVSSWLDNLFCLGEKQAGTVVFFFKNEPKVKCQNLELQLKLPAGVEILGGNGNTIFLNSQKQPDGSTITRYNIQRVAAGIRSTSFAMWQRPSFILRSNLPAGEKIYPLEYTLFNQGQKVVTKTLKLKIIPAKLGAQPQKFVSGFHTTNELLISGRAATGIKDLLVTTGFNAINGGLSKELVKLLDQAQFQVFTSPYWIANGYRIGSEEHRTPESYFRRMDGQIYKKFTVNTCPVEIYSRGKFYRANVWAIIEDAFKSHRSSLLPNWEPYYFSYAGCFCPRCREEFVKYMAGKAQPEAIRAQWPRGIFANYKADWVKFRSWQHGQVLQTLEADTQRIGKKYGKDGHVIPEIAWNKMIEATFDENSQDSVIDYIDKIPYILPWGPYVFVDANYPYVYYPGIHLITYMAARDIKNFAAKHVPNPAKRPKLFAYPHGLQGATWYTEPEAISFEYLCFFANAWEGVICYYFPQGYDHRYLNALAESNTIIAQNEKEVLQGQNIDQQVQVTAVSPLPPSLIPGYWNEGGNFKKELPDLVNAAMLQFRAYQLNSQRVVALGNFWSKGEVFARVQVQNLEPQEIYSVNCSGNYALGKFTGRQLSRGIMVQIGALRWNFLRIAPVSQQKCLPQIITQKELKRQLAAHLPQIKRTYQADMKYIREFKGAEAQDNPVNDFKSIYSVNMNTLTLKPVVVKKQDYLEIKSPEYRVLLDPAAGAALQSFQLNGRELVDLKYGRGLMLSAFWGPLNVLHEIRKGYLITGVDKTRNGIAVELTRVISKIEKATLQGLKVVKTFTFEEKSVTVTTKFTNNSAAVRRFAFRYPCMTTPLTHSKGHLSFAGQVQAHREGMLEMVRIGQSDPVVDKVFKVDKFLRAPRADFQLRAPGYPVIKVSFPHRAPHAVALWDGGHCASLEPVFPTINLQPQQSVSYSMKWSWQ